MCRIVTPTLAFYPTASPLVKHGISYIYSKSPAFLHPPVAERYTNATPAIVGLVIGGFLRIGVTESGSFGSGAALEVGGLICGGRRNVVDQTGPKGASELSQIVGGCCGGLRLE